jgi:hypothetical protein
MVYPLLFGAMKQWTRWNSSSALLASCRKGHPLVQFGLGMLGDFLGSGRYQCSFQGPRFRTGCCCVGVGFLP